MTVIIGQNSENKKHNHYIPNVPGSFAGCQSGTSGFYGVQAGNIHSYDSGGIESRPINISLKLWKRII